MRVSRVPKTPKSWRLQPVIAILTALVVAGTVGCDATPTAAPPPGLNDSAQVSATTSATATAASTGIATDYCTLAERIATESGVMVNKHWISPLKATVDQFKAVVNLSLAAKNQLVTGLPAEVRSALLLELEYFQVLKDSDFAAVAETPAQEAARKTVDQYGVSACGFVYDQ